MLRAADELAKEGFVPTRDTYFMTTCCEETSGNGADTISKALLDRGIRFALTLDEGGMILTEPMAGAKGQYAMVGVGEKGYVDLKFTARSTGGHASTPSKNTPLVRLGKFMAAAEKKNRRPAGSRSIPRLPVPRSYLTANRSGPPRKFLPGPKPDITGSGSKSQGMRRSGGKWN